MGKFIEHTPYPEEKLGTKYRVLVTSFCFIEGDIIYLNHNDGTDMPWFVNLTRKYSRHHCISWYKLERIQPKNVIGGEIL